MDTTNQCVGTLGAGHGPEADASAAGGRTARGVEAGPRDLGKRAEGRRDEPYRMAPIRHRCRRRDYLRAPVLLLLGVVFLALLRERSRIVLATAVDRRWIGGPQDGRWKRIRRDQLKPRQEGRRGDESDQKSPQRVQHVGEEKVRPPLNRVYVTNADVTKPGLGDGAL